MNKHSKIRSREHMKQLCDFSGLRWGTITPTDIDGYFEIGNNIFAFIEIKYKNAPMPGGQQLAFERLVDIVNETKSSILVIGIHENEFEDDVDVANCKVREYRINKKWIKPKIEVTVREILDWFIQKRRKYD